MDILIEYRNAIVYDPVVQQIPLVISSDGYVRSTDKRKTIDTRRTVENAYISLVEAFCFCDATLTQSEPSSHTSSLSVLSLLPSSPLAFPSLPL